MTRRSVEVEYQDPQRIDSEHAANTVAPDECAGLTMTLNETCERVLSSLTPKERKVLDLRLAASAEPTISQERIREIEERALRKLRR